ncbi:MAG: ATP-binding cassette domain-containing protein, partial [Myxococcota bacterium]|nr:ATP-binding cassette domain-containing protein [Myxococcota bacterium]
MLHLLDLHKSFGSRRLFEGLKWHVSPGERIGLIGPNGSGKTTLFRMMAGEMGADQGEVVRSARLQVGHLAQEPQGFDDRRVIDVVVAAAPEIPALEAELQHLQEEMATASLAPDVLDDLTARYETAQARFEALGGYGLESEARRILVGLGFSDEAAEGACNALSGGWAMRVALARLLLARPGLLLL